MLLGDVISRKINVTAISQKHNYRYKPAAWVAEFQSGSDRLTQNYDLGVLLFVVA